MGFAFWGWGLVRALHSPQSALLHPSAHPPVFVPDGRPEDQACSGSCEPTNQTTNQRTRIRTRANTTHIHTRTLTHTHTYTHAYLHTRTRTHAHLHARAHTRTRISQLALDLKGAGGEGKEQFFLLDRVADENDDHRWVGGWVPVHLLEHTFLKNKQGFGGSTYD